MTRAGRAFLAERALADRESIDPEARVFRTVDGRSVSLADVADASKFGFAPKTNHRARKLAEGWSMMVLDESDEATSRLKEKIEEISESVRMPEQFDVEEKADSVSLPDTHDVLADSSTNTVQGEKLAVAREMARRMGIDRTVRWGRSEVSDSWTDGRTEIVLTDSAAPERARAAWMPQVFRALVREWAHTSDSRETDMEGYSFNRRYRRMTEDAHDVLTGMTVGVNRDGVEPLVADQDRHLLA
jgi:hypothetical protein